MTERLLQLLGCPENRAETAASLSDKLWLRLKGLQGNQTLGYRHLRTRPQALVRPPPPTTNEHKVHTCASLRLHMRSVRGRASLHTCLGWGGARFTPTRRVVTSSMSASGSPEALSPDRRGRCCGDGASSPTLDTGLEENWSADAVSFEGAGETLRRRGLWRFPLERGVLGLRGCVSPQNPQSQVRAQSHCEGLPDLKY